MVKVLIVDDAEFIRVKMNQVLLKHNFTVIEAENGEEAVKQYTLGTPDIVIMDVTMPIMNGITAVKKIVEINKNARVIMLTNVDEQIIVMDAINNGACDYLIKPVQEQKLVDCINKNLL